MSQHHHHYLGGWLTATFYTVCNCWMCQPWHRGALNFLQILESSQGVALVWFISFLSLWKGMWSFLTRNTTKKSFINLMTKRIEIVFAGTLVRNQPLIINTLSEVSLLYISAISREKLCKKNQAISSYSLCSLRGPRGRKGFNIVLRNGNWVHMVISFTKTHHTTKIDGGAL